LEQFEEYTRQTRSKTRGRDIKTPAKKTSNQPQKKHSIRRTPKKTTPSTVKPDSNLDVIAHPSTPTSAPTKDAFELLSSQFDIITQEVIRLRDSELKHATTNAKLTGEMEQMEKRLKEKDEEIKWLRNQIAK
jgi:hypothetical protein